VDFYCTGSQKAMGLPPGLAFGVASERFLARAGRQRDAGYYFSMRRMAGIAREHLPWWTPAVSLLLALQCQVRRIAAQGGWIARWNRHQAMRELMDRWIAGRGDVRVMTPPGTARSPAISSVVLPDRLEAPAVIETLERRGFLVGGPLDPRHGPVIRIGHMGDLEPAHLEVLLGHLAEVIG
jgi:aspartate aminotransferase-like enzyme